MKVRDYTLPSHIVGYNIEVLDPFNDVGYYSAKVSKPSCLGLIGSVSRLSLPLQAVISVTNVVGGLPQIIPLSLLSTIAFHTKNALLTRIL